MKRDLIWSQEIHFIVTGSKTERSWVKGVVGQGQKVCGGLEAEQGMCQRGSGEDHVEYPGHTSTTHAGADKGLDKKQMSENRRICKISK